MKKLFVSALMLALVCPAWCTKTIKNDVVIKAMESEITRSVKKLSKAKPPVYFLSYQITDANDYSLSSYLGNTGNQYSQNARSLDVEVRVGNRQLDNTRKIKSIDLDNYFRNYNRNQQSRLIPLDDDIKNIKTILWLETEDAVKLAQQDYLKVKTNTATASDRSDNSNDFSPALPAKTFYQTFEPVKTDTQALKKQLNEYSALFKGYSFIFSSSVNFSAKTDNVYFVNSEGTKIKKAQTLIRLSYNIVSRNQDGMTLERNNAYDIIDIKDMPAPDKVKADIENSISELKALQNAPVAEPFHGPVILKNRATGVFFHEILGHRVEGHRQKDDDFGQTFTNKLNQQVISPMLSVYDNPTMQEFNGIPLRGYYAFDDEGVPSQDTKLVENGILKGFLMSRSPINGFPQSNGHGRKQPGNKVVSRMGITYVKAAQTVSFEKLREMLIEEIKKQNKPYGLIIDDISGGFTNTDTYGPQSFKVQPLLVYKVYPDGRPDEVIRGADIVGTPLTSFNKVIAAADDYSVFNGSCGAESGWVPVSAIAPSLLISELEVEKVAKTYDNLPILPNPAAKNEPEAK